MKNKDYTIAVIAKDMSDYHWWIREKKFKLLNGHSRWATDGKRFYVGMSQPHHAYGYKINEIVTTETAVQNKNFNEILNIINPCLIYEKKSKNLFGRLNFIIYFWQIFRPKR